MTAISDNEKKHPRYYSTEHIGWATALASPYAGLWMLAQNLKTFDKPFMASKTLLYGGAGMTGYVFLALAIKLPAAFGFAFFACMGLFFNYLARKYQRKDIKFLQVQGFPAHSLWQVVKVCLGGMAVLFLASYVAAAFLLLAGVDIMSVHNTPPPEAL